MKVIDFYIFRNVDVRRIEEKLEFSCKAFEQLTRIKYLNWFLFYYRIPEPLLTVKSEVLFTGGLAGEDTLF